MNYRTIKDRTVTSLTIKNSRFITILQPMRKEEEFEEILAGIRKEWPKARHYCFAYRLHSDPCIERMSDDGEPSGTAGGPMLEILKGADLQDVLAVVVRYFGGTLLGTGGLLRAYSDSVRTAMNEAVIQEMVCCQQVIMEIDYSFYGQIEKKCLPQALGNPVIEFMENVRIAASIPMKDYNQFLSRFEDLTNRQGRMISSGTVYEPISI